MVALEVILVVSAAVYCAYAVAFAVGLRRPFLARSDATPFVSVVIAARDEEGCIGGCLADLSQQDYPPHRYEVLIVDDASADSTADIVLAHSRQFPQIRLLHVGDRFVGLAAKKRPLSVGIREAGGEIILTTDADCRVPRTWISGIVACYTPEVDGVIGFSQVKQRGAPLGVLGRLQAFDFLTLMSAAAGSANLGLPLAASGQNLSYRRCWFDRVGGFRDIGHRASGDDVLLVQLLRRGGARQIVFAQDPGTYVTTVRSEALGGLWQQRRRWASNALYLRHLNLRFFGYVAAVFLVNLLPPVLLAAGAPLAGWAIPAGCWSAKVVADALVAVRGAGAFGRSDLLCMFPLWELLQTPYTVLIGLAGSLAGFSWKGRRLPH